MAHGATQWLTRGLLAATLLAAAVGTSGCGWLAGAYEKTHGRQVLGEYKGLANRSVAIVVYSREDLINEYPSANREISEFLKVELIKAVPTIRLVDPQVVIEWQNNTLGWDRMSEQEVAQHFGVERVIWIELVEYRTKEKGIEGLVQGHIDTNVRVVETGAVDPDSPVWRKDVGVEWPPDGPVDMMRVKETDVRRHTLELYGTTLANAFADHKEFDPSMVERRLP